MSSVMLRMLLPGLSVVLRCVLVAVTGWRIIGVSAVSVRVLMWGVRFGLARCRRVPVRRLLHRFVRCRRVLRCLVLPRLPPPLVLPRFQPRLPRRWFLVRCRAGRVRWLGTLPPGRLPRPAVVGPVRLECHARTARAAFRHLRFVVAASSHAETTVAVAGVDR